MQTPLNCQNKQGLDVLTRTEETGLLYFLLLDNKKQLIGVKRYAGAFCFRCNASLLIDGEESGRRAIKHQCAQCPVCSAENVGSSLDVIACTSFDWIMAPHLLPRKSPVAARSDGKKSETFDETKEKERKESFSEIEIDDKSRRRRKMTTPSNSVVDQYGNLFDVEQFWKRVVDPCPIQFYDRITQ